MSVPEAACTPLNTLFGDLCHTWQLLPDAKNPDEGHSNLSQVVTQIASLPKTLQQSSARRCSTDPSGLPTSALLCRPAPPDVQGSVQVVVP